MSKLLMVAAAVAFLNPLQAQTPASYVKGDVVRLAAPATGDPLPDSRVIAVAGDRIQIDKSGVVVNGQPVRDIPPQLLEQFARQWDQVVPVGHYYVVGERHDGPHSVVMYHGLIPAENIVRKVSQ